MRSFFQMWRLRRQSLKLLKKVYAISRKYGTLGKPLISLNHDEIAALNLRNIDNHIAYLCSKGLLEVSHTPRETPAFRLTDAGNNYFPDDVASKINTIVRGIVLPLVTAVLTTLLTMWITGFFEVRSKTIQPISTSSTINTGLSATPHTSPQPPPPTTTPPIPSTT